MIKHVALLTPVYVSLFWSLVFLIGKDNLSKPKSQLGKFMVLSCMLYFTHVVFFSEQYHLYSILESVYIFTTLSVYPMYYFYVLLLTNENVNIQRKIQHFLPAIIFGLFSLFSTFVLSEEQRINYVKETLIENNLKDLSWETPLGVKGFIFFLARVALLVQIVFYVYLGTAKATVHNKRVSNYYSDINGRMLNWVRDINIIILVVAIASFVFAIIGRSYFSRHEVLLILPSAIFSIILFEIGFKGNQQLHSTEEIVEPDALEDDREPDEKRNRELKKQIAELFEEKRIYNQADLRITNISEQLKTNRTYISRLINEEFGMNFNEYVNAYRINEAKDLLENKAYKKYTMEYIAEMSGFGSVNSFNRVFKEIEGVTPGQFKKRRI